MKTNEMTPEDICIRCAEIEGWTKICASTGMPPTGLMPDDADGEYDEVIPDYCNSIDMINDAVLRLPDYAQYNWLVTLESMSPTMLKFVTASALDRARAFVKIHE